ncbi:MAG: hypothetical protein HKP58_19675 [Desulfatitalea sp.]|nr:PAAR domain-containing protein [Desulfatitalea sp.]NNK02637.1 hypothetical protein [Desulfatitalea sp.]
MPGPAARSTDPTAHGGLITGPGCPTVLIGGLPAARVGADMHVCPMVTPAVPPVPHVGGPITGPGVPTVLIGGMPAATVGDLATCAGPPAAIVMGCPTVLIGTGGGGGASVSAGGGAVQAAGAGAISAVTGQPGPKGQGPHWFKTQFVDSADLPVTEVRYALTDPDGRETSAVLTGDGTIRRGGLPDAGDYKIQLFVVYNAQWSKSEAKVGDTIKLTAETEGYADGTPALVRIWEREISGLDNVVTEMTVEVKGDKIEAQWEYQYPQEREGRDEPADPSGYASPEYFFMAHVREDRARSGQLKYQDHIEIELKDQDDHPVADEAYILRLPNGEVRKGKLDKNGYKKEEKLPPGRWNVEFPEIKDE